MRGGDCMCKIVKTNSFFDVSHYASRGKKRLRVRYAQYLSGKIKVRVLVL